jgi:hypothetical protein
MESKFVFKVGEWVGLDSGFILMKDNIEKDQYESYKTKNALLQDIQIRYGCMRLVPRTKRTIQGIYSYTIKGEDGWKPEVSLIRLTNENIHQYIKDFEEQVLENR